MEDGVDVLEREEKDGRGGIRRSDLRGGDAEDGVGVYPGTGPGVDDRCRSAGKEGRVGEGGQMGVAGENDGRAMFRNCCDPLAVNLAQSIATAKRAKDGGSVSTGVSNRVVHGNLSTVGYEGTCPFGVRGVLDELCEKNSLSLGYQAKCNLCVLVLDRDVGHVGGCV